MTPRHHLTHTRSFILSIALAALLAAPGCALDMDEPDIADGDVGDVDIGNDRFALAGPNLLANAGFDAVGPSGPAVSVVTPVPGGAGHSAADRWTMFTNTAGYITSDLVPSTRRGSAGRMIHVHTRGAYNGLVQLFDSWNRGPSHTFAYAWVYAVRGQVGIGTGNGGATGIDATTTTLNQWQRIEADNGNDPANEFIIYSTAPDTEFYVDDAGVYSYNLLANPSVEQVGPLGPSTAITTSVPGGAGASAADSWTLFTNTPGTIITERAAYMSSPGGSPTTLHVITDAGANGVVQVFAPFGSGPTSAAASVWVYVRSGTVYLGTGNGGSTGPDAYSTTNNQWELLHAPAGVQPANELIVYSDGGGADFYLDDATVVAVP